MTPAEFGRAYGIDPKRVRDFLRSHFTRSPAQHGQRWDDLSSEMIQALRQHFGV